MFNVAYPMETISATKQPYKQNDSSQVQEGRSLFVGIHIFQMSPEQWPRKQTWREWQSHKDELIDKH